MPTMTKLSTYVRNTGTSGRSASQSVPCGTLSSSTMIVIRIAITPSLNPSRRPFVMRRLLDVEFAPTVEVSAPWPPAARLVRVPKKVARHHVYVIELDPAVLEHAKFRAANPGRDPRTLVPLALELLESDPFAEGDFYGASAASDGRAN